MLNQSDTLSGELQQFLNIKYKLKDISQLFTEINAIARGSVLTPTEGIILEEEYRRGMVEK